MSVILIDQDNSGGATTRRPVALIRFNTEAATPGNATVRFRTITTTAYVMDWGDGDVDFVRTADITIGEDLRPPGGPFVPGTSGSNLAPNDLVQYRDHVYAAPGIYNATLYSLGNLKTQIRCTTPTNEDAPNATGIFPNLMTRLEFLPGARYQGYDGFLGDCPYLTALIFPVGEGVGRRGTSMVRAFPRGCGLTAFPRTGFGIDFTYDCTAMCGWNATMLDFTSLISTSMANVTSLLKAFISCTAITTPFPAINTSGVTGGGFVDTWRGCSNMSGAFPLINTAGATSLASTWSGCSSLTSFPLINTAAVTNFDSTWGSCAGLTSFPLINTPVALNYYFTWAYCTGLTSFPLLNSASVTSFEAAWLLNTSLTSFPLIDTSSGVSFNSTWNGCASLSSFPLINTAAGTEFPFTWSGCSSLTSFPLINTAAGTNFFATWNGCSGLTSFPLLDMSDAVDIRYAWWTNSGLSSFPAINFPSVLLAQNAWRYCSGLTSFPLITMPQATCIRFAWAQSGLTSFPAIAFPEVTNADGAWTGCNIVTFPSITLPKLTSGMFLVEVCRSLTTFPAGVFDASPCTNYFRAFDNCPLTAASVNNILISIDTAGTSNGILDIQRTNGDPIFPAAPTGAGLTAKANLQSRGWTVNTQ